MLHFLTPQDPLPSHVGIFGNAHIHMHMVYNQAYSFKALNIC